LTKKKKSGNLITKGGISVEFKIREARQAAGISQKDLAARLGISPPTLSGYESGAHDPKSDLLSDIADICGVSVDYLLGRAQEEIKKISSDTEKSASEDTARKLGLNEVINAFVSAGLVRPGEDLTDADLRLVMGIIDLVRAWRAEKNDSDL